MTCNENPSERSKLLISQLVDGHLSAEEAVELDGLLQADAVRLEHVVDQFLLDSLLTEELGPESLTALVDMVADGPAGIGKPVSRKTPSRTVGWSGVTAAVACALILGSMFLWLMPGQTPVSAAATEIHRIIAASTQQPDRTYQIAVEEKLLSQQNGARSKSPEDRRPPKPPMNGAVLHVRGHRQFVLLRTTKDGLPFVTGSNGKTSWAVRPDGPVRVSSDLGRFSHDLPGHEHSMPLINIQDGLERLLQAYDVQLLPVEEQEDKPNIEDGPSRLIVAVKKRSYRGPRRVEITYAVRSGLIRQMRFVEMPYGPERLSLRMTLVEERQPGANFFDHESHHDAGRVVEFEE